MNEKQTPTMDPITFAGYSRDDVVRQFIERHMAFLAGTEVKMFLYIFVHTLGRDKQADYISLSQFLDGVVSRSGARVDHGTGCSKQAVVAATANLESKGLIVVRRAGTPPWNGINLYAINVIEDESTDL